MATSPAAWHPDPNGRHDLRYWDGNTWTPWVASYGGEAFVEHLAAAMAPRDWDRKALNALERDAQKLIGDLDQGYGRLADLTHHAARRLRQEFQTYAEAERRRTLAEMPVERLSEFSDRRLNVALVRQHGIRTVNELAFRSLALEQISGIGPVGADAFRSAADEAREWALAQPISMPRPDDLEPRHTELLRAAAGELRSREVPAGLVPRLEITIDGLRLEAETLGKHRSLLRRVFKWGESEGQIEATATDLFEEIHSPSIVALRDQAAAAVAAAATPADFAALAHEYRTRFADYGSVLERVVIEFGGAGDAIVENARGGLPATVAARIEALELQTDGLDVHLRGYQEFGIQFMVEQARTILGDEMGLGKTIQALGAMTHVRHAEAATRFIVVAPASTLANWEREIDRRSDLVTYLVHGAERQEAMTKWLERGGVALTSYATLRSLPRLDEVAVDMLVADEAHYAKNPSSQRSMAVERLSRHARRIVLMTGTPLENDVDEFANLIKLANPEFVRQYGSRLTGLSRHAFRSAVAPIYLRRNQDDVLSELPERIELEEWVELGAAERRAHREATEAGNVMGMRQATFAGGPGSAKLQRLQDLLDNYRADGQKVLIFSYFLSGLDAIREMLPESLRIDGSVTPDARQDIIERFAAVEGHWVLASQITAGGVGLNIQAASVVVLLEPQVKPTTEWQAIARAHRMGQSRRVTVHRLLARECVDESLHELVGRKSKIFDDYARESMLKESSAAATELSDDGMMTRLLQLETGRLQDTLNGT